MFLPFEILSAVCTENHRDSSIWDDFVMSNSSEFTSFQMPKNPAQEILVIKRESFNQSLFGIRGHD